METIGGLCYFTSVLGALPAFTVLEMFALVRLAGWRKIPALLPAGYITWRVFDEFGPVLLHWQELETTDLRRLAYERWSAVSRPALIACVVLLSLVWLLRRHRDPAPPLPPAALTRRERLRETGRGQ
jgi:hypothetical protein